MGYFRATEQKKRNIKVYYQTKNCYGAGVYYDDQKQRYIRYSPNSKSGLTTLLKRLSKKKLEKPKKSIIIANIRGYMITGGIYSKHDEI